MKSLTLTLRPKGTPASIGTFDNISSTLYQPYLHEQLFVTCFFYSSVAERKEKSDTSSDEDYSI